MRRFAHTPLMATLCLTLLLSCPAIASDEAALEAATAQSHQGARLITKHDFNGAIEVLQQALLAFDKLLEAEPENRAALNGRGYTNLLLAQLTDKGEAAYEGDLHEAIRLADAAIAANVNDAQAYYDRATAQRFLRNFNEARMDYSTAIGLDGTQLKWASDAALMESDLQMEELMRPLN